MPAIAKVYSEKVKARIKELGLTPADLLGMKESRLIFYPLITGKPLTDVRTVFEHTEEENGELIKFFKRYVHADMTTMEKARAVASCVNSLLLYKSDQKNWGKAEYMARPIETFRKGSDDCDGYAALIVYVLRLFGVSEYEVYMRVGDVLQDDGKIIGHATPIILDLDTLNFYPIEGSFYPDRAFRNFGDVPLQENSLYKETWWITNDKLSYSYFPWLRFVR